MSENKYTSELVSSGIVWVLYDPEAKRYYKGMGERKKSWFSESYELLTCYNAADAYKFWNNFDANRAINSILSSESASIKRLEPRKMYFEFRLANPEPDY